MLSFARSREWHDSENRVAFSADDSGGIIIFFVGFTTLDRFGTVISPQDALRIFGQNRPTIQRVAAAEHKSGKVILDSAAFDRHSVD